MRTAIIEHFRDKGSILIATEAAAEGINLPDDVVQRGIDSYKMHIASERALYIDEPFAKNAGFPSALAPGMIAMGFLAELATEWVRGARLRRFGARFVKIVWPGDVLTARGRVVDRRFATRNIRAVPSLNGATTMRLLNASRAEPCENRP